MNKKAATLAAVALISVGGLTACGTSTQDCRSPRSLGQLSESALSVPAKGGGGGGHSSGGGRSSGGSRSSSGKSGTSSGTRPGTGTGSSSGFTGFGYRPNWYPMWMPWWGGSRTDTACR
jgi:hypothetical protein